MSTEGRPPLHLLATASSILMSRSNRVALQRVGSAAPPDGAMMGPLLGTPGATAVTTVLCTTADLSNKAAARSQGLKHQQHYDLCAACVAAAAPSNLPCLQLMPCLTSAASLPSLCCCYCVRPATPAAAAAAFCPAVAAVLEQLLVLVLPAAGCCCCCWHTARA